MCGDTSAVMPAFSATDRSTAQALCLDNRRPRVFRNSAGVPPLPAASAGRPRTRYASSAARAYEPTGTMRSLSPLPRTRSPGVGSPAPPVSGARRHPHRARRPRRSLSRCRRAAPTALRHGFQPRYRSLGPRAWPGPAPSSRLSGAAWAVSAAGCSVRDPQRLGPRHERNDAGCVPRSPPVRHSHSPAAALSNRYRPVPLHHRATAPSSCRSSRWLPGTDR